MPVTYREDESRQGLITLCLAVGIILVGWLLLWPNYSGWRASVSELTAVKIDLSSKQASLDAFDRLVANYNSKASELAILDTSLPNAPKVPQLLSNLEFLVVQSGLKLNSLRITDPTVVEASYDTAPTQDPGVAEAIPHPELVELKIEVSLEGDYGLFRELLEALERNLRLLEVRSIVASPIAAAGQATGAAFGLVLGTSYQK